MLITYYKISLKDIYAIVSTDRTMAFIKLVNLQYLGMNSNTLFTFRSQTFDTYKHSFRISYLKVRPVPRMGNFLRRKMNTMNY